MSTSNSVVVQPDTNEPKVDAPRPALRYRYPLATLILRRLVAGIATVLAASILIYLAILVLPGDVASVVLGRNATPDRVAEVHQQLGLDRPIWERFASFLGGFLSGDFGESTAGLVQGTHIDVAHVVLPALGNSGILALITMILFIPLTLGLGLLTGVKAYRPVDHVTSMATLAVSSLPEFLAASALIAVFFSWLGWLPPISSIPEGATPFDHPAVIVLPILTLLLLSLSFGSRLLRATVIDVMAQDYVTMARLSGFSTRHVLTRYVLPNSLVPVIQIFAQQIQYLIGGMIVIETVFNYPGIGTALVRAIAVRDTQETVVIATILAALYILINLIADVICIVLDPKTRTSVK
jgi:peptide/nickel transport system permease protein